MYDVMYEYLMIEKRLRVRVRVLFVFLKIIKSSFCIARAVYVLHGIPPSPPCIAHPGLRHVPAGAADAQAAVGRCAYLPVCGGKGGESLVMLQGRKGRLRINSVIFTSSSFATCLRRALFLWQNHYKYQSECAQSDGSGGWRASYSNADAIVSSES